MTDNPGYVCCEWFHSCTSPSVATVGHPTLGDVEICQRHLDWAAGHNWSPTVMIPPMATRTIRRNPEVERIFGDL